METPWFSFPGVQGAAGRRLEELAGASSKRAVNVRPGTMGLCYAWYARDKWTVLICALTRFLWRYSINGIACNLTSGLTPVSLIKQSLCGPLPFWILRLAGISWAVLFSSVRQGPRSHDRVSKWIFLEGCEVDWIDEPERNRWASCHSIVCTLYDSRGIPWSIEREKSREKSNTSFPVAEVIFIKPKLFQIIVWNWTWEWRKPYMH